MISRREFSRQRDICYRSKYNQRDPFCIATVLYRMVVCVRVRVHLCTRVCLCVLVTLCICARVWVCACVCSCEFVYARLDVSML